MKTYSTNKMLDRLASDLIVYKKPFTFDGYAIEFRASEEFMQKLYGLDPMLQQIEFEIH